MECAAIKEKKISLFLFALCDHVTFPLGRHIALLILTDRVRGTMGRLCFDTYLSLCPHLGGYPSQVQTGGTPARSDRGCTPVRGCPPGVPRGQVRMGGTPARGGTCPGYPLMTGQHMEYLIRGGRYASYVHAGGLSSILLVADRFSNFQMRYVQTRISKVTQLSVYLVNPRSQPQGQSHYSM